MATAKTKTPASKSVKLNIMDRVKSYEDACSELKLDPKALPDFSLVPAIHRKALLNHYKLIIIAQALNEKWVADWSDWDQYKYYPWFQVKKTGFGFSDTYCVWSTTLTNGGSRLCFRTEELAEYAGKTFTKLYESYLIM